MRPLLIFGASRGVGLELARIERAAGRPVVAVVRQNTNAEALEATGTQVLRGNALERGDVTRAFAQLADEYDVVSTLGGQEEDGRRADDIGNINIIEEAELSGKAGRFLLITSIGCGDMAPYRSARAVAAFGAAVDAKTIAEDRLKAGNLRWTIVRPGGLLSEPATGRGILAQDPEIHGFIHRQDVAQLVGRALRTPATTGHAFAAVDDQRMNCVNAVHPFPLAN